MPIYAPGKRNRHGKRGGGKRNMVVILSLTAMVDMFTVLVVFLLQNYKVEEITLKRTVALPKAMEVKKLRPSHVVVIEPDKIFVDDLEIADTVRVKEEEAWHIYPLIDNLKKKIEEKKKEAETAGGPLKQKKHPSKMTEEEKEEAMAEAIAWGRVTLQSDKEIDFLTVKKVMFSITEAGATLINFAVEPSKEDEL